MVLKEVKNILREIVKRYHPGAIVVWANTKGVTPVPPYITLGCRNLNRTAFPMSGKNGEHRYYSYDFIFEINLFTSGRKVQADEGFYYENTAVEDLEEFIRFLDSDEITDELSEKEISVICNPPIRDLSELINDVQFRYRSMCEFSVSFTGLSDGRYGVAGSAQIPNPSGGGSAEMANAEPDFIEEAEIEEGGFVNEEQSTE